MQRSRLLTQSLLSVALATATALPASAAWLPRIVNGSPTTDFPATAMVILYTSDSKISVSGLCSGTLIGCRTVLTAGHCVCPDGADDYATCVRDGIVDPATVGVFLPNSGLLSVQEVRLHPEYQFAVRGDLGLLILRDPADAVAPAQLTRQRPFPGTNASVVGYGTTRGGARAVDDTGIKRTGSVVLTDCPADIPSDTNLCWNFLGSGSNTCGGDSGGGLFFEGENGPLLAGVVSGGSTFDCQAPDQSFATSIEAHLSWLLEAAGADLGSACNPLDIADRAPNRAEFWESTVGPETPRVEWPLTVPPRTRELRVTFNGQTGSSNSFFPVNNDFDLYLLDPTGVVVCADENPNNWGSCRVPLPTAGSWTVRIQRVQGQGSLQATATLLADSPSCAGDCNGDGAVDVAEIVRAVAIALGEQDASACLAADHDGNGEVTIDEILRAVGSALDGCG